ncbi:RmlC-like jelly roll fold [Cynara cardunculus var. scolymus]|uniref:RmlC-like jelly roll fold n=1 Tax=Cynara cardunculus var. scolymus TaxID=59895 RepID=A0A103Y424_CYNCS|nr:RmlC-like jelly roll fold [Cynara cardunculus var. scolymus]
MCYPIPLRDFCVAAPNRRVFVNGELCKDLKLVQADDFFFSGLHLMGDTSNTVGSNVTVVTAILKSVLSHLTLKTLSSPKDFKRMMIPFSHKA